VHLFDFYYKNTKSSNSSTGLERPLSLQEV